jgi:hypothetical protein
VFGINFSRSYRNFTFITPNADICITSAIETYQLHLNSKSYVTSTTFGRAKLSANIVANQLFLALLVSEPDVGVKFLKDVGLIRSNMVCGSAYRDFETHGYTHQTVNNTIGLLDVRTRAHTNSLLSTGRHSLISKTEWGTASITWPTTHLRRGADPTK